MENKAHALATGLFVLLLGAALIGVIAWFQGDHRSTNSYTVVAVHGVPGLNLKAPVKLAGVEIGKVEDVVFDPSDSSRVLVSIEVAADAPLKTTTRARLGYQGITGLSFIDLSNDEDTAAGKRLAEGARIELRSSKLDELMSNAPRVLASIDTAARRLSGLLDDGHQQQLFQAVKSIDSAAQSLAHLADDARTLKGDARTLIGKAGNTLESVDALTVDGRLLARDLRERAAVLDRVGAAADQLQSTSKRLELAIAGPEKGERQALVEAVNNAARAVEKAAKALETEPQGVLLGKSRPPAGPGEPGFVDPSRK